MEKQRIKSDSKSCRRLLIILAQTVFFITGLFSQNLTLAEINQLQVVPADNQSLFTKTEDRKSVV